MLPGQRTAFQTGAQVVRALSSGSQLGQGDHRHGQNFVQPVESRLAVGRAHIAPGAVRFITGHDLLPLRVRQEQGQVVHGFRAQLARRGVVDAALLNADVHQIRGVLRQGQVTARLQNEQDDDDRDRLP